MKFYLLLSVILFISAVFRAERLTFGHDENKLKSCIEYHLSMDSDSKIVAAAKSLSEIATHRFLNKSHERYQFEDSLNCMCYRTKRKRLNLFSDKKAPELLNMSMRKALESCVERKNLPKFDDEPQVLTDLLDYILVDWPTLLEDMISAQEGRSTLRMYAYSVGLRLMSALRYFSMDYRTFRRELRRIWMRRAEQFYDVKAKVIYIQHRFTTDQDRMFSDILLEDLHTIDDVDSFIPRRSEDFSSRNLIVRLRKSVNSSCPEDDIYMQYSRYCVTSAENYLETHLSRCYRILFFVLEQQSRGMNADVDDTYNGRIPNNVLPFSIQAIVWSAEAYIIYRTTLQQYVERFLIQELDNCSLSGAEELIILLTLSIIKKTARDTTTAATIASTTTIESTSSTITKSGCYEEGSKKGGTRSKDYGKYFLSNKKFRTMFPEQDHQSGSMDNNFHYYGHIFYNGNSTRLGFIEKNQLMYPEILMGLCLDKITEPKNFLSCN